MLRWESLQLDGIQAELEPLSLAISQVSLNNYQARIRVQKDGQINLNQISPETPTTEPARNEAADITETAAQNAPASLPPFRIDELTLQGGEVSFVDKHLPEIYATTMHELGGRISGLTTE
ncbi:MAG: DUF748 domain-containing protein, partial [Geopsychrobacter sp.]|nr:DUF748 domain-containing protein [Geopsychrobacter sp.]